MTDAQVLEFLVLIEGLADIIIDTYIAEHRDHRATPRDALQAA